jgi:hypothetical protein
MIAIVLPQLQVGIFTSRSPPGIANWSYRHTQFLRNPQITVTDPGLHGFIT